MYASPTPSSVARIINCASLTITEQARFSEGDYRKGLAQAEPEGRGVSPAVGPAQERHASADITRVAPRAEAVHRADSGTSSRAHMDENIKAVDVRFTPAEWSEFNTGFSKIPIVGAPNHEVTLRGHGVEARAK